MPHKLARCTAGARVERNQTDTREAVDSFSIQLHGVNCYDACLSHQIGNKENDPNSRCTSVRIGGRNTVSLFQIKDLQTNIKLRSAEVKAVAGISHSIEVGETVGLVGESGCGKTITGLSIMRLLPPGGYIAGGEINFAGEDLSRVSEERIRKIRGNEIGMIFQDPMTSLNPSLTVGEQIAEAVRLRRGYSKAQAKQRAEEVLGLVGMPNPKERVSYYPHQLSGGLRQRVMIAISRASKNCS